MNVCNNQPQASHQAAYCSAVNHKTPMPRKLKIAIFATAAIASTWLTLNDTLAQMSHHSCQAGTQAACAKEHS